MKIAITSNNGDMSIILAQAVPRIGEQVDMFYATSTRVTDVIWWPGSEILRSLKIPWESGIEAVVLVG